MIENKKIGVVLPAAGKGERMGSRQRKQFLKIDGKPIILRTMEIFQAATEVDLIVVAADTESIGYIDTLKQKHRLSKVCSIIQGGAERQDSVWNGLKELAPMNVDLVLIHDAVRPFITQNLIHSVLIDALKYDAAITALSLKDTVKHSREQNFIEGTYDRKLIWLAQTPQAFRFSLIYDAYEKAFSDNFYSTDDASLVERLGKKVRIVEGFSENIKITTPDDLELAELIVKRFVLNNT